MPCPCVECTCGDDCRCAPGHPGCDPCGAFQKKKAAEAQKKASEQPEGAATTESAQES